MQNELHSHVRSRTGIGRRIVLQGMAALGAAGTAKAQEITLPFANGERPLARNIARWNRDWNIWNKRKKYMNEMETTKQKGGNEKRKQKREEGEKT